MLVNLEFAMDTPKGQEKGNADWYPNTCEAVKSFVIANRTIDPATEHYGGRE